MLEIPYLVCQQKAPWIKGWSSVVRLFIHEPPSFAFCPETAEQGYFCTVSFLPNLSFLCAGTALLSRTSVWARVRRQCRTRMQRLNKTGAINCLNANTSDRQGNYTQNSGQLKWHKKSGRGRDRLFGMCCKMSRSQKPNKNSGCNTKKNATEYVKQWVEACFE